MENDRLADASARTVPSGAMISGTSRARRAVAGAIAAAAAGAGVGAGLVARAGADGTSQNQGLGADGATQNADVPGRGHDGALHRGPRNNQQTLRPWHLGKLLPKRVVNDEVTEGEVSLPLLLCDHV